MSVLRFWNRFIAVVTTKMRFVMTRVAYVASPPFYGWCHTLEHTRRIYETHFVIQISQGRYIRLTTVAVL